MCIRDSDKITPENTYSKSYRLQEIDDSALIDNYTQKMYLQVSGAVLEEADDAPVEDAHCEITNTNGEICGFFDGTVGGNYAEQYIPLYKPAGCIPYEHALTVAASMRFTSPTVAGEDTVRAEGEPGAAINPVDTAQLGTGGIAMALSLIHI